MMLLTFKMDITKSDEKVLNIIKELSWHVEKVYNSLLYEVRENQRQIDLNKSLNILASKIYMEYRKTNWHSKYLHSHTLQQVILNVIQNYKSYIRLKEMYEKDNGSLKGKPRLPRYKHANDTKEIVFTKYAIRIENNKLKLSLSKEIQDRFQVKSLNFLISNKLKKLVDLSSIKMIKIILTKGKTTMNIIYERETKTLAGDYTNICAIDLGLNNIVALTNKENTNTLIVSGKEAKSKNKYILDRIKHLQQINMKMLKEAKYHKNTKQINKLYEYRQNYIKTFMHKVSKMVVEYAIENKCYKIIVGDLKGIKQDMGYNKDFVRLPLQILVQMIEYKVKLKGIEVVKISERYTSGVSALDNEEITKENYNPKRRKFRGLFITNNGKKINADINGSLNILRKYIINYIPNSEMTMDNGREQRPIKKRVA